MWYAFRGVTIKRSGRCVSLSAHLKPVRLCYYRSVLVLLGRLLVDIPSRQVGPHALISELCECVQSIVGLSMLTWMMPLESTIPLWALESTLHEATANHTQTHVRLLIANPIKHFHLWKENDKVLAGHFRWSC